VESHVHHWSKLDNFVYHYPEPEQVNRENGLLQVHENIQG
jgi:hypothetical protein